MKVKICGLTQIDQVKTCIDNGADYCGFILNYPKSHRFITIQKAAEISNLDKKNSKFVAVLVNPNEEELKKVTDRGWLLMKKYTQDWYATAFVDKIDKILSKGEWRYKKYSK